jgi:hypothetical protein
MPVSIISILISSYKASESKIVPSLPVLQKNLCSRAMFKPAGQLYSTVVGMFKKNTAFHGNLNFRYRVHEKKWEYKRQYISSSQTSRKPMIQ